MTKVTLMQTLKFTVLFWNDWTGGQSSTVGKQHSQLHGISKGGVQCRLPCDFLIKSGSQIYCINVGIRLLMYFRKLCCVPDFHDICSRKCNFGVGKYVIGVRLANCPHVAKREDSSDSWFISEVQKQFWPGMSAQIEETVAACRVCTKHYWANPKEPLMPVENPDRPWAKIRADHFELNNHHCLIMVDCFSKWPEISKPDSVTAKNIITCVKSVKISRYRIPDEVITDSGPQFACTEFAQFIKDYDIVHTAFSPYHP